MLRAGRLNGGYKAEKEIIMQIQDARDCQLAQREHRKPVGTERKNASRKYEVSSSLMPKLRQDIIDSMRAGREVKQCSDEYQATQSVVLAVWLRAELRKMDARLRNVEDRMMPPPGARLRLVA